MPSRAELAQDLLHGGADCRQLHFLQHPSCLVGWCICVTRDTISRVGDFDERFDYYYQDNDYAETIRSLGITHFLVTSSRVRHEFSRSEGLLAEGVHEASARLKLAFEGKWGS